MKRTIYTIALILLTQITFGQIKTIKVQGAGGGTPINDSVVIYTGFPLQVIDSAYVIGGDTLHKYTIQFRSDSLVTQLKYSGIARDSTLYTDSTLVTKEYVLANKGGAFIPLSGTVTGSPVTGNIELNSNTNIFQGDPNGTGGGILSFYPNNGYILVTSATAASGFEFSTVNGIQLDAPPTSRGLKGNNDFTANIQPFDYTQKKYVDTAIAHAVLASSGGGVVSFNGRVGAVTPLSGDYSSYYYPLSGNPSGFISSVPAQSWASITGKPSFATVATTGAYSDLTGKPTIPAAQVNSDWNSVSGVSQILNKPTIVSTESDPVVKAISGIVKSNGTTISAATAGTDYLSPTGSAASLTSFPTFNQSTTGNAATATILATARTIGGVSFNGSVNINLPGVNVAGNQSTTGNAGTATKLATARNIAGVAFDGSANISLNNNAITNGASYITAGGVPAQTWSSITGKPTDRNNETSTGSASSTLTLANTYISGSVKVWKNGIRITDFTEAGGANITLTTARVSGDTFIIDYKY